jgi:hypothetical protein
MIDMLSGPHGANLVAGFALGCVCSWGFFQRNIAKMHTDERLDLKMQIERNYSRSQEQERECRNRILELEDRISELERQNYSLLMTITKGDLINGLTPPTPHNR